MKIDVVEEDIKLGCVESSTVCPVARALTRNNIIFEEVGLNYVKVNGGKTLSLPTIVVRFILNIMLGKKVEPFSFEIEEL
jgi:hypothetical protein